MLIESVETRLRELLAEKAAQLQTTIAALKVMPDHVHRFIETDPRWSIAPLTRQLKGFTSHVLREDFPTFADECPPLVAFLSGGLVRIGNRIHHPTLHRRAEKILNAVQGLQVPAVDQRQPRA